MIRHWLGGAAALALLACSQPETVEPETDEPAADAAAPAEADAQPPTPAEGAADQTAQSPEARLDAALETQPDEIKARYEYRHPKETLMFFGVEPGMTVVDTLPGGGWYTKILLDYLGPDGKVIGADYSAEMWTLFGQFSPPPEEKANWASDWVAEAGEWRDEDDAELAAFAYGSVPDDMAGTADAVLVIRALHHFNRFEDDGGYLTSALADMNKVLKPGGVIGVVQHRAPVGAADEWANGDNGYLKESQVIAAFEAAGFALVDSSEINANPNDQPTEEDFVWRLPPTLATSQEDDALKAEMEAIGESDRMTLKFRKPD